MLCQNCGRKMEYAGCKEPQKLPEILGMDYCSEDVVKLWMCMLCGQMIITTYQSSNSGQVEFEPSHL